MQTFNKKFVIGTAVWAVGSNEKMKVTEINSSRTLIKVDGLAGSFQRGHITKFSNK